MPRGHWLAFPKRKYKQTTIFSLFLYVFSLSKLGSLSLNTYCDHLPLVPVTVVSHPSSPPCSLTLTVGNILVAIQMSITRPFHRKSNLSAEDEVYLKFFIPFCAKALYLGLVYFEVCSQKMGNTHRVCSLG